MHNERAVLIREKELNHNLVCYLSILDSHFKFFWSGLFVCVFTLLSIHTNLSWVAWQVIGPNTVVNGELVCVHQRKVMSYNKEMNSWNQLGHISGGEIYNRPFSRFGFACESVENNLYIIGGTRDYTSNRTHYCSQLNAIEICDLQSAKAISQAWWKLGADMGQGKGIISASAVLWL